MPARADPVLKLIATDPAGGEDGAISPDGRFIVTSSRREGTVKLWLYDRSAEHWRVLTHGEGEHTEPSFSPDDRRVVFVSSIRDHHNLWTVDITTGAMSQLTEDNFEEEYPAWSPDGRWIVFTGGPWKQRNFYIVSEKGGEPRPVLPETGNLGACHFGATSSSLICNTYDQGFGQIMEVNVATGSSRKLTDGRTWPYKPSASPDGRWVAYTEIGEAGDRIRLLPLAAAEAPLPAPSLAGRWPLFTRSGAELFFLRMRDEGSLIQLMDVSTGELETVPLNGASPGHASLSADGRLIAYCAEPERNPQVWIYDRVTKQSRQLRLGSPACQPVWSPDGRRLAVTLRPGERWEIATVSPDGTSLSVITSSLLSPRLLNAPPAWSPDGHSIAFSATTRPYESRLFVADLETGLVRSLTSEGWYDEGPSWTPDGHEVVFMSTRGGAWSWGLFAASLDGERLRAIEPPGFVERRFPIIDRSGRAWWIETDGCLGATFIVHQSPGVAPERLTRLPGARWFELAADGHTLLATTSSRGTEYWIYTVDTGL